MEGAKRLDEGEAAALFATVWPENEMRKELWDVWTAQGFSFASGDFGLGFYQKMNGPCGTLTALNALVLVHHVYDRKRTDQTEKPEKLLNPSQEEQRAALVGALHRAFTQCRPTDSSSTLAKPFRLLLPSEGAALASPSSAAGQYRKAGFRFHPHDLVLHEIPSEAELQERVECQLAHFMADGGAILLLYALVLTRGLQLVEEDMQRTSNAVSNPWRDSSLIAGELGFCTQAMVNLVMNGRAVFEVEHAEMSLLADIEEDNKKRDAGAHERDASQQPSKPRKETIGFLSEVETEEIYGGEIAEGLKNPQFPIWVLGGGGHYTLLFSLERRSIIAGTSRAPASIGDSAGTTSNIETTEVRGFDLYHFNGLPPGGPRLVRMTVSFPMSHPTQEPRDTGKKQVTRLISRRKSPGTEDHWLYEVTVDKNQQADNPAAGDTDPIRAQPPPHPRAGEEYSLPPKGSGKWRCLDCTLAEPVVWSAYNDEDQPACKECHQPIEQCGRCLWLPYSELPRARQLDADRMYAPTILKVLRTKWPQALLNLHGAAPPSL